MNTFQSSTAVLPASLPSRARSLHGFALSTTTRFPQKKQKILLVDDDPSVRNSLQDLLSIEGYEVVSAPNGHKAAFLLDQGMFDLAIVDLCMPCGDGWSTIECLQHRDRLTPVILITARSGQIFRAEARGVAALFEKPIEIPDFLETIQNLLQEPRSKKMLRAFGIKPHTLLFTSQAQQPHSEGENYEFESGK